MTTIAGFYLGIAMDRMVARILYSLGAVGTFEASAYDELNKWNTVV
jgi:hypothetical protein